jgi:lipopolysaccharide transport system permease protein
VSTVAEPGHRNDGPTAATTPPLVELRGGPGGINVAALGELWAFREVLWAFVVRFVKVKYKQAFVGIGWAIIQPVAAALVLAFVLGRLADVPSEGVPYLLFALAGMVGWTYFSTAAGTAMESLVDDRELLRKVYFPRETLPLGAVGAGLVDLGPGLLTLFVFAAAYGELPTVAWLALPLPLVLLVLSAAALGLAFAGLNVYYRDIRYAMPYVLQLGLFLSPVLYPARLIDEPWRTVYEIVNPVAAALDGLRTIVARGDWPDWGVTFAALGWAIVLVLAGYAILKRLERGFADRA